MIIGVPKEIKNNENRVALTPAGAAVFKMSGHKVIVEQGAGQGSGFNDEDYQKEGAQVLPLAGDVWQSADMIMKVKEPLASEFPFFKKHQILFTYLHLAAAESLASSLIHNHVSAVAYETIQLANGGLPLLTPMSEVAGRMSVQVGAQFLEAFYGGRGVLLGGVPGVPPAKVIILGGGIVGTNAAKIALGMGADVVIIERNAERMRYLDDMFNGRVSTLMSNPYNIGCAVEKADLLVGAVLIPGARAPRLVTEDMVRQMKKGAVIVDVAVDQGGSIETINRVTTHSEPTYVTHGVIHYAVANMPGAVPRTSTLALTNVTLPYALEIADKGLEKAASENNSLQLGVNTYRGKMTHKAVADSLGYPYTPLLDVISNRLNSVHYESL